VVLALAVLRGEPVWPQDWTPIVALTVSSQLFGQGLLVYSLKHFTPLVIGLALLTQPAVASLVGWLAFDETLAALDLLGMALVGFALVLARTRQPGRSTAPTAVAD
jgi:drug/metabolite transporter (DMT)-like permease